MKIDPVFPTGSQFTPPRYKFVRSPNGFRLSPYQGDSPSQENEVVEVTSPSHSDDGALVFSLSVLVLVVLFV